MPWKLAGACSRRAEADETRTRRTAVWPSRLQYRAAAKKRSARVRTCEGEPAMIKPIGLRVGLSVLTGLACIAGATSVMAQDGPGKGYSQVPRGLLSRRRGASTARQGSGAACRH